MTYPHPYWHDMGNTELKERLQRKGCPPEVVHVILQNRDAHTAEVENLIYHWLEGH